MSALAAQQPVGDLGAKDSYGHTPVKQPPSLNVRYEYAAAIQHSTTWFDEQ
jgi:hypothetical protein